MPVNRNALRLPHVHSYRERMKQYERVLGTALAGLEVRASTPRQLHTLD